MGLKKILARSVFKKAKVFFASALDLLNYYPAYLFASGRARRPKTVVIEPTLLCNCRCFMCQIYGLKTNEGRGVLEERSRKRELSLQEYEKLFNELKSLKTPYLKFTGGEPFMRKDFLEILRLARENNFPCGIITNGALITEEVAKELVRLQINDICFSIDGSREAHNEIRGADVFDSIMNAIDYINKRRSRGKPAIGFNLTINRINCDNFSEVVKIAKEKKASLAINPLCFSSSLALENTKKVLPDANKMDIRNSILDDSIRMMDLESVYEETKKAISLSKAINQELLVYLEDKKDILRWFIDDKYFFVNKCFSPWYSVRIGPYGQVYPCSLEVVMGNIRENSFKAIWNNEKFMDFRKILKKHGAFPYCARCCCLLPYNKFWNFLPKAGS